MTSGELRRWMAKHERRAVGSRGWIGALVGGGVLAAWVQWRLTDAVTRAAVQTLGGADAGAALAKAFALGSRAWLLACVVAFGIAFLRVPFHLYWRRDSALLAQLPVEGQALFDAAMVRCVQAAAVVVVIAALGLVPLARLLPVALVLRHLALVGLFGLAAAAFVPATVIYAASVVAGNVGRDARAAAANASQLLGAIPGGLGAIVIVLGLLLAPWLVGGTPHLPVAAVAILLGGGSVAALVAARPLAARMMGKILRDVAALDRQRLAVLEIRGLTGIESALRRLGGLVYDKDARLMRRRYPLAYALGAVAWLALVILAVMAPAEPWVALVLVGMGVYAGLLAVRLWREPIERRRLALTLPVALAAFARAKQVWLVGWWAVFVLVPAVIAVVRAPAPLWPAVALAAATIVVGGAGFATAYRPRGAY